MNLGDEECGFIFDVSITHTHTRTHTNIYTYIYIYIYIYIHMYTYLHNVCRIYIYIYQLVLTILCDFVGRFCFWKTRADEELGKVWIQILQPNVFFSESGMPLKSTWRLFTFAMKTCNFLNGRKLWFPVEFRANHFKHNPHELIFFYFNFI